jgi:hypothetical protein
MTNELVPVTISARGRWCSSSLVYMPLAEFERLDKLLDGDRSEIRRAHYDIDMWIDPVDIVNDELDEIEEFHIERT